MVDATIWGTIMFVAIASMTPGPNNLLLAASGANFGFSKTLPHMFGVILGFAMMVIASGFGLEAIVNGFPEIISLMKVLSVLFLLYLSWRIATGGRHIVRGNSRPLTFIPAFMFQIINPKSLSFLLSIMGAQLSNSGSLIPKLLPLFVLLAVFNILSSVTWTMFGTAIGKVIQSEQAFKIFNTTMALLLVGCTMLIAFG